MRARSLDASLFAFRDASSIPSMSSHIQIESSTSIPYHRHPTYRIVVRTVIHNPVNTMKRRRPDPLPTLQTGKIYKLPGERVHTTHTHKQIEMADPIRPVFRRRKQSGSFTTSPTRIILTPPHCHHTKTYSSTVNPASR